MKPFARATSHHPHLPISNSIGVIMRLKSCASLLSLSIGLTLALVPAYATTITTYSNPTIWAAATTPGYQTVTFEGLAPSGGVTNYFGGTGLTSSGVEFIGYTSSGTSDGQVIDTSAFSWYNDNSGDAFLQSMSPSTLSSPLPY